MRQEVEGKGMAGAVVTIWMPGFACSAIFYYLLYRDLEATPWRIVAALFWPVGIPVDFIFYDRRWPQRLLITAKQANRPSRQRRRRKRQQVKVDYYKNPPKLGGWR